MFEAVCQAVAYAHSHHVVHRDLKPHNVMVGAFGEVQVMDWGLAKVLTSGRACPGRPADDSTPGTEIRSPRDGGDGTQAGSVVGTPAYMPPEQAIGAVDQIDARSDVFGLGGILCAILTGRPPYAGADAEAVRRLAARASLREAFAALDGCGAEPDLVALCKRCLAAEPDERPADGAAVAGAVQRMRAAAEDRAKKAEMDRLAAEVRAAEERKRRRWLLAAAAAVITAMSAGVGVAVWQAVAAGQARTMVLAEARNAQDAAERERDARGEAEEQKAEAEKQEKAATAVKTFLQRVLEQTSAEGQASKERVANSDITLRESLDYAAKTIEGAFPDQPLIEAELRNTIGIAYGRLGGYSEAESHLSQALALREAALGPDHPATLAIAHELGFLYQSQGQDAKAEPFYRRAMVGREKSLGPDHPNTLTTLGNLAALLSRRRPAEAETLYKQVLARREKALGPAHPSTLGTVNNLAFLYESQGRYEKAESLFKQALAGCGRALGESHPTTLKIANNLAALYHTQGRNELAEMQLKQILATREKVLGPDNPDTLLSATNLGYHYLSLGRYDLVEPLFKRVMEVRKRTLGPHDPETLKRVFSLAELYDEMKRPKDSEPLWREALAGYTNREPDSAYPPFCRSGLGGSLLAQQKYAEAEPLLLDGFRGMAAKGAKPDRLREAADRLFRLYEATDQREEAKKWRAERAQHHEPAPPPRPAK